MKGVGMLVENFELTTQRRPTGRGPSFFTPKTDHFEHKTMDKDILLCSLDIDAIENFDYMIIYQVNKTN